MRIKHILVCIITFSLLQFPGCWDMIDIEKRNFVMVTGIDKVPQNQAQDGKYKVTLIMPVPRQLYQGQGGGGGVQETPNLHLYSTGNSIFGAIRKLNNKSSRQLNFEHMDAVVIGEEMARQGIRNLLDFMERNKEILRRARLFIAQGKAEDILEMNVKMEPLVLQYVTQIAEQGESINSNLVNYNLAEIIMNLKENQGNTLALRVKRVSKQEAVINGSAVIKDWKLVDWMGPQATRGAAWLLGSVRRGIIEGRVDPNYGYVFEIKGVKHRLSARIREGSPVFYVDLQCEGDILEQFNVPPGYPREDLIKKYEKNIEENIKKEVSYALNKLQQDLKVDALQFGEHLMKYQPQYWEKAKPHWDKYFPFVDVKVNAVVKIRRLGVLK